MRRWFALLAPLALCGVLLGGCAWTDYCNNEACNNRLIELNVADEALGCSSLVNGQPAQDPWADPLTGLSSAFDLTQTPIDNDFIYCPDRTPTNGCQSNATFGPPGCVGGLPGGASLEEAAAWGGSLSTYAFLAEAQVFGGGQTGTWVGAGIQSMGTTCDPATGEGQTGVGGGGGGGGGDCGSGNGKGGKVTICHRPQGNPDNARELCVGAAAECAHLALHESDSSGPCAGGGGGGNTPDSGWNAIVMRTYQANRTGSFSCVASQIDGIYGGPEGQLLGDGHSDGRIPGLRVDVVTIDNAVGVGFGRNIRAMSANRNTLGFNIFAGVLGRGGEGRYEEGIARPSFSAGLAEFLSGEPIELHLPFEGKDITLTVAGSLGDNGMFDTTVLGASYEGNVHVQNAPLYFSFDRGFKRLKIGREGANDAGLREFVRWMVNTMPMDEEVYVLNGMVEELGFEAPHYALQFGREAMVRMANGDAGSERELGSPLNLGR